MKTFNLSQVEGIKEKEITYKQDWNQEKALSDRAYNELITSLPMTLDVEKIEIIAVQAMNKEQLRNGITQPTHEFSEYCSCGRCHTATILSQALSSAGPEILRVVKS